MPANTSDSVKMCPFITEALKCYSGSAACCTEAVTNALDLAAPLGCEGELECGK